MRVVLIASSHLSLQQKRISVFPQNVEPLIAGVVCYKFSAEQHGPSTLLHGQQSYHHNLDLVPKYPNNISEIQTAQQFHIQLRTGDVLRAKELRGIAVREKYIFEIVYCGR